MLPNFLWAKSGVELRKAHHVLPEKAIRLVPNRHWLQKEYVQHLSRVHAGPTIHLDRLFDFRNAFQIYPAILELERGFVWVVQTMQVKRADFLRRFKLIPDIRGGNSHFTKQQSIAICGSSFFYFKTNSGYFKICWTPYGHHYAGSSFAAAFKDSFLRQFPQGTIYSCTGTAIFLASAASARIKPPCFQIPVWIHSRISVLMVW